MVLTHHDQTGLQTGQSILPKSQIIIKTAQGACQRA